MCIFNGKSDFFNEKDDKNLVIESGTFLASSVDTSMENFHQTHTHTCFIAILL